MSILPLTTAYALAVGTFAVDLRVIDTHYDKQGANDVQVVEGERIIQAAAISTAQSQFGRCGLFNYSSI